MEERFRIVVVGGGHAGLSVSHELTQTGVDHLVLERGLIAQSWRTRWDSFCLVTPNWTIMLPGGAYVGNEPDGFMPRDDIVAHIENYAKGFDAPVRTGVDVVSIESESDGGFRLQTADGDIFADKVVVATGTYQRPYRPAGADEIPSGVHTIDAESYTNPDELPEGRVLVVGSGQTGCQIAEELNEAGRSVVIACGKAPWGPRRIDGRDLVSWVYQTPFLDQTLDQLPHPMARLWANVQSSGKNGGHDLHYRVLLDAGVTLAGRFLGVEEGSVVFANDLHDSVAWGDERLRDIRNLIHMTCAARGEAPPEIPEPRPFESGPPERMALDDCGAVIFTSGFRPDYASWIPFPHAFDEFGFPLQKDGASSVVPGLYFIGTHFLRKRKSATFMGIAEDAAVVAAQLSN